MALPINRARPRLVHAKRPASTRVRLEKASPITQNRLTELPRVRATPVCDDFLKLAGFCAACAEFSLRPPDNATGNFTKVGSVYGLAPPCTDRTNALCGRSAAAAALKRKGTGS